jgi:hypothetical protein
MFVFDSVTRDKMKDLSNFISWVENQNIDEAEEHLRSQHVLLDLDNLNFIGRLESFEEDLKKVAEKIGMPLKEMYRENTSGQKEIELSDENRTRIQKIYKKDYELLYPETV